SSTASARSVRRPTAAAPKVLHNGHGEARRTRRGLLPASAFAGPWARLQSLMAAPAPLWPLCLVVPAVMNRPCPPHAREANLLRQRLRQVELHPHEPPFRPAQF